MKKLSSKAYMYAAGGLLLLCLALGAYYFLAPLSHKDNVEYVYIDQDDNIDSVLAKVRPIAHRYQMMGFSTMLRHTDYAKNIRTGRFEIAPGVSTFTILRHIKNGHQAPLRLVLPESRTMHLLAGALGRRLMMDSLTIDNLLRDSATLASLGYDTASIAAMFVPNTYEVYWNIEPKVFLHKMQTEHDAFWKSTRSGKAQAIGLTPLEVATIASIVDEETANTAEKPMVAGMYINRLHQNMPLQADPTIKFAWQDFTIKRIHHKLLSINSPYNTYKNTGLPPGPIKIASVRGIDAVLDYTHHNYIYMCAKEDFSGTHNFATTYEEHLRNAAKYSAALDQRGIE